MAKDCPCHCQYCGFTGHKADITTKHKKNCSKYPLPCPNSCELGVVPSAGMAAHRKVCPLELVQCQYYTVGCYDMMVRRELENHYNQKMTEHLNLMSLKLNSTVEELTESENKLMSMGKELRITKKALDDTRVNYDKLIERISTTERQLSKVCMDKIEPQPIGGNQDNIMPLTAMRIQHEQDMKLGFVTNFFRKHNSIILAIIIFFLVFLRHMLLKVRWLIRGCHKLSSTRGLRVWTIGVS